MAKNLEQVTTDAEVQLYRQRLLEATNAAYAALRENPSEWEEELAERRLWENTLLDGLNPD
jgi:hypothetical protein